MRNQWVNDRIPVVGRWLGTALLATILLSLQIATARADSLTLARTKLIWPSAAAAFPTGRFGTPDEATNHAGHHTGFDAGMDLGYMVGEYVAIGVGADYAGFNMDFGGDTTSKIYKTTSARTTALSAHFWIRAFFPGGYDRWRPYAILGLGIGRPKAKIVSPGHPEVARFEYTVGTSVGLTGGIGVLVPLNEFLSLSIEPRYRMISTKGAEMEEVRVYHDGTSETFLHDQYGNRLHQKSNTTWWELRGGLTLTVR
jgi:hypothetical protein